MNLSCAPRVGLLLVSFLLACSREEGGIRLRLDLAQGTEGKGAVVTPSGKRVTLRRGFVVIQSVEIFSCAAQTRWWQRLTPISTAHAHGVETPTRFAVPQVESLLRPAGEMRVLGELAPPPGSYCRVRVVFGPADADAEGLPNEAGVDLVGKSFWVEGEGTAPGAVEATPLSLTGDGVSGAEVSFLPVTLSREIPEGLLTLRFDAAKWLDALDLQIPNGAPLAQALSASISADASSR